MQRKYQLTETLLDRMNAFADAGHEATVAAFLDTQDLSPPAQD